jgi:AbrB family looped-hinge helix DNA binding protein
MRMRVTSRGRVTIPKVMRERFGMTPGTDVDFFFEDGVVVIRKRVAPVGPNTVGAARKIDHGPKPAPGNRP